MEIEKTFSVKMVKRGFRDEMGMRVLTESMTEGMFELLEFDF